MPIANREPRFQALVIAQNKIGWQHTLEGRFSHHLLQIQQHHIYTEPEIDDTKQSGEWWLKLVLHQLWTSIWQVWLTRNNDLHGREKNERECKRIEKLAPQVIALYAQVDHLLASDKILFDTPIAERLQAPSREISTWIRPVTPTIKQALADANTLIRDTNHTIPTLLVHREDPRTINVHINKLRPV
jgi:hypothetical protein